MITAEINNVFSNYLSDKDNFNNDDTRPRKKANYTSALSIEKNIPAIINSVINVEEYASSGTIGQGGFADVPWIAVFDKDITTSAQYGYYIVYLFDVKMEGLYLCLGLGWTQYNEFYGNHNLNRTREHIKEHSIKAQNLLRSTQGFSKETINLNANNALGRGYELGNIVNKYYPKDNLPPDNEIMVDLQYMIGVYRELKGEVGKDVFQLDKDHSALKTDIAPETEDQSSDKIDVQDETPDQAKERIKASITGDKAEKIFKDNALELFGWQVIDKTDKQKLGYDFLCEDPELYIEVKGCRGNIDSIRLTIREWEVAEEKKDKYRLIIVYNLDQVDNHLIIEFIDPYSSFNSVIKEQIVKVKSLHINGRYLRELVV